MVAAGYRMKYGKDYIHTYSPTAFAVTIRLFLAIVAAKRLHLRAIDVCTAFLYGEMPKEHQVYCEPPPGIEVPDGHVLLLKKRLYGLKNAPRIWFLTLVEFLTGLQFTQSEHDPCLFYSKGEGVYAVLVFVVDDIMFASDSKQFNDAVVAAFRARFKIKDMGQPKYILGMHIEYDQATGRLALTQERYIKAVAAKFGFDNSRPKTMPHNTTKLHQGMSGTACGTTAKMKNKPYRQLIGCILYCCLTPPDICVIISILAKYSSDPGVPMWNALYHLM